MATLHQVQAAIQSAVSGVAGGIVVEGKTIAITVGIGWPSQNSISNLPKAYSSGSAGAIIGVYDTKRGRNVTRWNPYKLWEVDVPCTLTTKVSSSVIWPSGTSTITLGASVTAGDAASCVITSFATQPRIQAAQVALGWASDTPATVAAKLAAQINADPVLSKLVLAIASGLVVTLQNITSDVEFVASYTGNGGTEAYEIGRRCRTFQICCWSPTELIRQAVTDPIDTMLAEAENVFGFTLPDNTAIRVNYMNDFYLEDDILADIFRRDFMIEVDYPVVSIDNLYSVLAPVVEFQPAYSGAETLQNIS